MTCFFYGYNCCMRKHEIIGDIPSVLSNDEAELNVEALLPNSEDAQDKSVQD